MAEAVERTDVRETRSSAYAGWAERPYAITVGFVLMLGIAVLVRILLARQILAPWILGDELHYSELAKSFASEQLAKRRNGSAPGSRLPAPELPAGAYAPSST